MKWQKYIVLSFYSVSKAYVNYLLKTLQISDGWELHKLHVFDRSDIEFMPVVVEGALAPPNFFEMEIKILKIYYFCHI